MTYGRPDTPVTYWAWILTGWAGIAGAAWLAVLAVFAATQTEWRSAALVGTLAVLLLACGCVLIGATQTKRRLDR